MNTTISLNGRSANVLLVYPPISKMERYGSGLGLFGGNQIPLGIFYLASYLRKNGVPVHAIDGETRRLTADDIVKTITERGTNILGISSTTVAFHRALELARAVKLRHPQVITVIGGPHVSILPAQPLAFPEFDFAVRNEGELTLMELIRRLENGESIHDVEGLTHRVDGKIVVNGTRPYLEDLNTLPFPAFDLIPDVDIYSPPPFNYTRRPVINIITSRGCPFKCTFCETATFGRKIRMRSPENIVDEIELAMSRFGAREIAFVDDTFTVDTKRVRQVFTLARERGLSFPWSCMSRVDTVDDDFLAFIRERGCWYIALGIESGDEEILRVIKKNIKLAQVEKVVATCRKLGMVTKGFFMIGHPNETVGTIDATIRFAKRLKLDHVVVTINTPMPGSEQYERASEFGAIDESSWQNFNYWNPVFTPSGLTREVMLAKQKEFIRGFYLRPGVLLRNLQILLSNPDYLREAFKLFKGVVRHYLAPKTS